MKSARSGASAFGIVASAAIVSSGIAGSLLGGTPAEASTVSVAAPNVCGQPPAATSAARTLPAGHTAVVLDVASLPMSKTPKTKKSSSSASPSASTSTSATAKASATATATAKATASATPSSTKATSTPKATSSATATPKATSSASSSPSTSASSSPSSSPSKSASPSPSPSPTGSKSASPTPTPTPTSTKSAVQLCLEVQAVATKSGVHPGGTASYAIWVWPAGGAASGITVTISGKAASKAVAPKFTVCATASGRTCKVGGIAKGTSDELQATAAVPSGTAAGKDVTLTATAKASDATAPPAADAAIKITAKPSSKHSSPSPTPTPSSGSTGSTDTTGSGLGATLPPGILPTVPLGVTTGAVVPELPGPTTSAGSPGGLFPTVSPQPSASPSPYSAVLPNARNVRVADAAATFPFSTRLIGGELVGLAVLAAALAIAIVRFSLRRPRPQHGKDAAS
jgi:hypothetical protein